MFGVEKKRLGRRVALVIGNSDYDYVSDLPNAEIDAITIADRLRELGFVVIFRLDQSLAELVHAAEELRAELEEGGACDVALLCYAGHGVQLNGENFIVACDYHAGSPDAHAKLYPVQSLLELMSSRSAKNLIFLDACRDRGGVDPRLIGKDGEPRPEFAGGLGKMQLSREENTFVAYAADPGDVAEDGPLGFGSPFSGAVAKHLSTRAIDIHEVLQWVANDVRQATGGRQRPWAYSNMTGHFHLNPRSWRPFWIMTGLGALAGLVNVFFGVDPASLAPIRLSEHPQVLASPLLFALVLGFGVWRWGRGTLWAAAIAVVVYAGLAVLARVIVERYMIDSAVVAGLQGTAVTDPAGLQSLIATAEQREMLLVVILTGAIVGLASVISGALTTAALRPLSRLSVAFMFGVLSVVLFLGVLAVKDSMAGFAMPVVYLNAALWQASLGGNVGWAYSSHVHRRKTGKS
jgi:hypothetical protein